MNPSIETEEENFKLNPQFYLIIHLCNSSQEEFVGKNQVEVLNSSRIIPATFIKEQVWSFSFTVRCFLHDVHASANQWKKKYEKGLMC
jgi:hypothetical protein